MPSSVRPPRVVAEHGIDPVTAVLGVLALVAFAAAGVLRFLTGVLMPTGGSARYTAAPPPPDAFELITVLSTVGAAAVGAGILLFAATLVVAVVRHRIGRLPVTIGTCTLAVTLTALFVGLVAARTHDFDTVFELATLRTALIALAGASLPAVVVGAVRARALRR